MNEPNYFLPKNRYQELKYFCLQYKYYEKLLNNHEAGAAKQANARIAIYQIQNAILAINCGFDISEMLMDCVTNGLSYKRLKEKYGDAVPAKDEFYETYRKFFYFLNSMKAI